MSGKCKIGDQDFIDMVQTIGATRTAKRLGINLRNVERRRARLERRLGATLASPRGNHTMQRPTLAPHRLDLRVRDGFVLVGSDAHYWPGLVSPAHRGFVRLTRELKPGTVILNGDVIDGSTISRHPPIGWERRPMLIEELEAAKERTAEIEAAAPKAVHIWNLGNHDARFETRLAMVAPEYARVNGVHLRDHFPSWEPAWSVWINDDVVVKHRVAGGAHAAYNNTLKSGKSIVTGHVHGLQVTAYTDYNGTRWGVDSGTLADPQGPQFVDYTEDNPKNWRAGFAVLEFRAGKLLWPDVAYVADPNTVVFRGKHYAV